LSHIIGNETRSTFPRGKVKGGNAVANEKVFTPRIFAAAEEANQVFWTYPRFVGQIMSALSCVVALPSFVAGWMAEVAIQSFRNGRAMASVG
jgi:hypothetical protein